MFKLINIIFFYFGKLVSYLKISFSIFIFQTIKHIVNMKCIFLIYFIYLFTFVKAQYCGFDKLMSLDSTYYAKFHKLGENKYKKSSSLITYNIPVVFHIYIMIKMKI